MGASATQTNTRQTSAVAWATRRADEARVLREIEELCNRQEPGTRIPTHTDLMRELNAPERVVLKALNELRGRGRIVRRHGSGTYVAGPGGALPISTPAVSSRTIVVIAKPDHGFFDECISHLYSHADARDCQIVLQLMTSQQDERREFAPILSTAAGFILFGFQLAPIAKSLQASGNRVVIVGAPDVDVVPDVPCVCSDHESGGYLAVNHLINSGHRRIGFPIYHERELKSSRFVGYRSALNEARLAGVTVTDAQIDLARLEEWEHRPDTAAAYFSDPDAPTALVAWNDFTAERLVETLRRAKIHVPNDVSVIGYDNSGVATKTTPLLTTIDSGVSQLLSTAVRIALAPKPAAAPAIHMTIPNLIVRNSVSGPKHCSLS